MGYSDIDDANELFAGRAMINDPKTVSEGFDCLYRIDTDSWKYLIDNNLNYIEMMCPLGDVAAVKSVYVRVSKQTATLLTLKFGM